MRVGVMKRFGLIAVAVLLLSGNSPSNGLNAQESFSSGQNISPAYEGWEKNPDGSFNLVFGYMNRNWAEEIDVPVGAENTFEPGPADRGQPTHFFPRRNRFVFKIPVPADFGQREIVWTLTTHGRTEKAYGTLKPDYYIDDSVMMSNNGAAGPGGTDPSLKGNKPPLLKVDGEKTRTIKVGQPLALAATATDDNIPRPRALPRMNPAFANRFTVDGATGLRLSWFVYRGAGKVTFDPVQTKVWEDTRDGGNSPWSYGWKTPPAPKDGKWMASVTFSAPGTYVLRCLAHDGGLMTAEDITVPVSP